MDLEINDKTALVTGGSKGIGYGIAEALAKEGCELIICARHQEELEEAADQLRGYGSNVLSVVADLTKSSDIDRLVAEAQKEFGTIDILINSAGTIGQNGTFEETPLDEWRSLFDLNLFAVVELTQKIIPAMQEQQWGRIINVSSENGTQPYPDMIHYSASKGALDNFSKSLSKQYASEGILVNTISPAFIETPLVDNMMEQMAEEQGISKEQVIENFLSNDRPHIELERPGTIQEVGAVAAFLASEKASFVNGSNYRIDGGSVAAV
ncbi:MAG: ketoacyl reductase [Balneola sp.]|nr:ketoacyl reductase [Balneola sp.]|tara:strand:- start:5293 stop:6093 length:801 start_codon:yes stop_codon:yes gene_type:complete